MGALHYIRPVYLILGTPQRKKLGLCNLPNIFKESGEILNWIE
jgi:hypothetical protein